MSIFVNGIVSNIDKKPYIQIDLDGRMNQLTLAEARNVARDIETMCARTEIDAQFWAFWTKSGLPQNAAAALMLDFREFRAEQDNMPVERKLSDPDDKNHG